MQIYRGPPRLASGVSQCRCDVGGGAAMCRVVEPVSAETPSCPHLQLPARGVAASPSYQHQHYPHQHHHTPCYQLSTTVTHRDSQQSLETRYLLVRGEHCLQRADELPSVNITPATTIRRMRLLEPVSVDQFCPGPELQEGVRVSVAPRTPTCRAGP